VFSIHNETGILFSLSTTYGIVIGVFIACLFEICIYKQLRYKKSSSIIFLITSLGVYVLLQNFISLIWGDETLSLRKRIVKEGINVFGGYITGIQLITIIVAVILLFCLTVFMKKTKCGKTIQAVSKDKELSSLCGINIDRIILIVFAIGSALAGIAGILYALDVDMNPTMGMRPLMMGVVAMIIGGVGSISGTALGALMLGMAQNLGVWKISSQWQDAIAFGILLVFLLFKPEGIFGKKIRKSTV